MHYLITGGAGFIGSHLTEALISRGDQVTSVDNLSTGDLANLNSLRDSSELVHVTGSVLDPSLMNDLVEAADVVVHLAAAVGVRLITESPLRSLETNVVGTANVLSAADRFHKPVLVASTSEVYGRATGPMTEDSDRVIGATTSPRWSYAAAKTVDETLAIAYWDERKLPTSVVRFFNTVGPRQSGAYGMVLPRLIAQALTGQDLTVYGDGSQSRCFCHVDDTVRGVVGLLDNTRSSGNVFNIGATEEVTILEAAHMVLARTGSDSAIRFVPTEQVYGGRFEDLPRRTPDCTKIRDLTGWTPKNTFEMILDDIIGYAREKGPQSLLGAVPERASNGLGASPAESSGPAGSGQAPRSAGLSRGGDVVAPNHDSVGIESLEPSGHDSTADESLGGSTTGAADDLRREVRATSAGEAAEFIASITGDAQTSRLLVIAAEESVSDVLRVTFEHAGYRVATARDGAAALDALWDELPQAVIVDVNLPDCDGIALLHKLRDLLLPRTPMLVLSGLRQEANIVRVLESGADDCVIKPFNPRELVARLQRRLEA